MQLQEVFPGRSVIKGYVELEKTMNDFLFYVPYTREHETVWSPILTTLMLEICSQLESLWKFEAKQSPCVRNGDLNIKDYFNFFGKYLSYRWIVFWSEKPLIIYPYGPWKSAQDWKRDSYIKLDWWKAYNGLKHDRISNRHAATLKNAVHALAAYFLAILRCKYCRNEVSDQDWLSGLPRASRNLQAWLGEDSTGTPTQYIAVESTLFSYAVGWSKKLIKLSDEWDGQSSLRFIQWFDAYESTNLHS